MQKNNRLTINFFTRKHKVQSENRIVYCRITIDGERTDFSINREIKTNLWDNSRKRGRRASYQELELLPRYKHNMPRNVMHGQKARLVYVYPKFHLDKGVRIQVKLSEAGTSRLVVLSFK